MTKYLLTIAWLLATFASGEESDREQPGTSSEPCALGYCKGQPIGEEPIGAHNGVSFIRTEHTAFDSGVNVYFTRRQGVCAVLGYSSGDGDAHRKFVDFVSRNYGAPSSERQLSTWWIAELPQGRILESLHRSSSIEVAAAELPEGLESVSVRTRHGVVAVTYRFDNADECGVKMGANIATDF